MHTYIHTYIPLSEQVVHAEKRCTDDGLVGADFRLSDGVQSGGREQRVGCGGGVHSYSHVCMYVYMYMCLCIMYVCVLYCMSKIG